MEFLPLTRFGTPFASTVGDQNICRVEVHSLLPRVGERTVRCKLTAALNLIREIRSEFCSQAHDSKVVRQLINRDLQAAESSFIVDSVEPPF